VKNRARTLARLPRASASVAAGPADVTILQASTQLAGEPLLLASTWGGAAISAALFAAAWLLARASGRLARAIVRWHDRRSAAATDPAETGKIISLKRRETIVAVVRNAITIAGFVTAAVLALAQLIGGVGRVTAVAGASFLVVLVGFAAQRVLADFIAGLTMVSEGWYSVGDTVSVPGHNLEGVVEDVSLRRTRLRTVEGELINVHNSQIPAVRVLPRGVKDFVVEVIVTDGRRAREILDAVLAMLPQGPTTFARRPAVEEMEELARDLVRIRMRASVVPGREWLVDAFLTDLFRARAGEELIVHGPIAFTVDERAARSFARASAGTRLASSG
jgi:moderate conductance mechanosensitive channel